MPLANTDGPRDKHTKGSMWAITYMWTLKHDTNELTYETDSWTQRTDLRLPKGLGEGWIGSLGLADVNYYITE